ncbi:scabin-related ADP-ribosyltransferase [Actinokineospora bangkokensis]|uniref:Uncharacterized protein n=1 Tax=Actinokineospora bangkokensis TaxID=1193682 RepID=A0A1Q9LMW5_9PSEU|nr:toxin glutamine deamidase domain-containing protein [Actinokineospora bangkokensis]OLR93339.1 hypothetical protein BJP25_17870 [Actinokineospora bangkokensis]
MGMMVSDEVRTMFHVLTGEEWPDADESALRALADAWDRAAAQLSGELTPELLRAIATIRSTFTGDAEQAFADRMAPFAEGGSGSHLANAEAQFRQLAKFLRELALDVEYVKLVSIITLITLIAEMAWAIAMAFWTSGASMVWLAARVAIVRFLLQSLLGRLLIKAVQAQVFGILFQVAIDALAQTIQFGMGTRTTWNTKSTLGAIAVGSLGGALSLPMAVVGKAAGSVVGKTIAEIGVESLHETLTEAIYKYATEGTFEMNPFAASSGAVSGSAGAAGAAIGGFLAPPATPPAGGGKPGGEKGNPGPGTTTTGSTTGSTGSGTTPPPTTSTTTSTPIVVTPGTGTTVAGTSGTQTPPTSSPQTQPTVSTTQAPAPTPTPAPPTTQPTTAQPPTATTSTPTPSTTTAGTTTTSGSTHPNTTNPTTSPSTNPTPAPVTPAPVGSGQSSTPTQSTPTTTPITPSTSTPATTVPVGTGQSATPPQTTPAGNNQSSAPANSTPSGTAPVGTGQSGTPAVSTPNGTAPVGTNQPGTAPAATSTATSAPAGNGQSAPAATAPGNGQSTSAPQTTPAGTAPLGNNQSTAPATSTAPAATPAGSTQTTPAATSPAAVNQPNTASELVNTTPSTTTSAAVNQTTTPGAATTSTTPTASSVSNGQSTSTESTSDKPAAPVTLSQAPTNTAPAPSTTPANATTTTTTTATTATAQSTTTQSSTTQSSTTQTATPSTPATTPSAKAPTAPTVNTTTTTTPANATAAASTAQPAPIAARPKKTPKSQIARAARAAAATTPTQTPAATQTPATTPATQAPATPTRTAPATATATASSAVSSSAAPTRPDVVAGHAGSTLRTTPAPTALPSIATFTARARRAEAAVTAASTAQTHSAPMPGRSSWAVRQAQLAHYNAQEHNRTAQGALLGTQAAAAPFTAAVNTAQGQLSSARTALVFAAVRDNLARRQVNNTTAAVNTALVGANAAVANAQAAVTANPGDVAALSELTDAQRVVAALQQRITDATARARQTTATRTIARNNYHTARAALDTARTAARPFEASLAAAQTAATTAQTEVGNARTALDTARAQHAATMLETANAAAEAGRAATAVTAVRTAIQNARDAIAAVDTAQAQADHDAAVLRRWTTRSQGANRGLNEATRTAADLTAQIAALDASSTPDPTRRAELAQSLADTNAEIVDLRKDVAYTGGKLQEAGTNAVAGQGQVIAATTAARAAVAALDAPTQALQDAHDAAVAADLAATTAAETAEQGATDAKAAEDAAKEAAKQGEVERSLTLVSSLPPSGRIEVESIGSRAALVTAVATLLGTTATRADVQTAVDGLSADDLAAVANGNGQVTVTTTGGPVRVQLTGTVLRPGDTRTKDAVSGRPDATPGSSRSTGQDAQTPLSESVSSSLPLRIPLFSAIPIPGVDLVLRPTVYVGATGKRSQTMGSTATAKEGASTGDRALVQTALEITAALPGGARSAPVSLRMDLRVPDVTRTAPQTVALPASTQTAISLDGTITVEAAQAPVALTDSVTAALNNGTHAAPVDRDTVFTLLSSQANTNLDRMVNVDGRDVTVRGNGQPQVTLIGTTTIATSANAKHAGSSGTSRGAEANAGAGLFVGKSFSRWGFFVGAFVDFASGLTAGHTKTTEQAVDRGVGDTELVYQVQRPVTVTADSHTATGTLESTIRVPVELARAQGLPLPAHLANSAKPTTGAGTGPYLLGTDDIKSVPGAQAIADHITTGFTLGAEGTKAVEARFTGKNAVQAVYNSMYGGEPVTWVEGNQVHQVEVHTSIRPPTTTVLSSQTKSTVQDQNNAQHRRALAATRSAKIGVAFESRPVGKDSPGADLPKPRPQDGDPRPFQGGPTTSAGAPRVAVAAGYENSRSTNAGTTARDARATSYTGEFRGFDGTVDVVVVHRTVATPNWFQRVFMGGMMTGGPRVDQRLTEPSTADVATAIATGTTTAPAAQIQAFTVPGAVRVAAPADKLDWAVRALPASPMREGIYLGAAPALPAGARPITPGTLGEFATVEHVRVTTNTTEGANIALAKSVEALSPAPGGRPTTVRESPFGGGSWASWGRREITETRGGVNTTFRYKLSPMTKPGSTPGETIRYFLGEVGSRGRAALGLGGQQAKTADMVQPGRATDFNGALVATTTYSSPRLIDIRTNGTLQRNQSGDLAVSNTRGKAKGVEAELNLDVTPKRATGWGARLRLNLGLGKKWGGTLARDFASGGKQAYEYKGPTAWIALDTRYEFAADMNIRNAVKTNRFGALPVVVDQPDGALVQLPVASAIALFQQQGLDVPAELTAALPEAPATPNTPATTLLTAPGTYTSQSQTTVISSTLHTPPATALAPNPDALDPVRTQLTGLGVTGKWQNLVLEQVRDLLSTPRGHVFLRDPLAGDEALISVSDTDVLFEDVVDIRITSAPSTRAATPSGGVVPNSQATTGYASPSTTRTTTDTTSGSANLLVGGSHSTTPPVPAAPLGPDGKPEKVTPSAGAASGAFGVQPGLSGSKANSTTDPTSGGVKTSQQVKVDKVGRSTHEVDHTLVITRYRRPTPALDAFAGPVVRHIDFTRTSAAPVVLPGAVDLVAPDTTVSPALTQPTTAPTTQVVAATPARNGVLGAGSMWALESLGQDTTRAIRDTAYALLGGRPPRLGAVTAPALQAAKAVPSDFTRPGGQGEHVLHGFTRGSSLHNGGFTMFTSDDYRTERVESRKHTTYDNLYDAKVTAQFRPGSFRFVAASPDGVKVDLERETEDSRSHGSSTAVTWTRGVNDPGLGGTTLPAGQGTPVGFGVAPTPGADNGSTATDAQAGSGSASGSRSQSGRSYLFTADADFFVETRAHHSNKVAAAVGAVRDRLTGRPDGERPKVAQVHSQQDLTVRVWEADALREGLITLHDVWTHGGKAPAASTGLQVTKTGDGAVLHAAGPAPAHTPTVPATRDDTGRTLHIGPGVTQQQVTDFVESLPVEMRPVDFAITTPATTTFTAADLRQAVGGIGAPTTPSPWSATEVRAEARAADHGFGPLTPTQRHGLRTQADAIIAQTHDLTRLDNTGLTDDVTTIVALHLHRGGTPQQATTLSTDIAGGLGTQVPTTPAATTGTTTGTGTTTTTTSGPTTTTTGTGLGTSSGAVPLGGTTDTVAGHWPTPAPTTQAPAPVPAPFPAPAEYQEFTALPTTAQATDGRWEVRGDQGEPSVAWHSGAGLIGLYEPDGPSDGTFVSDRGGRLRNNTGVFQWFRGTVAGDPIGYSLDRGSSHPEVGTTTSTRPVAPDAVAIPGFETTFADQYAQWRTSGEDLYHFSRKPPTQVLAEGGLAPKGHGTTRHLLDYVNNGHRDTAFLSATTDPGAMALTQQANPDRVIPSNYDYVYVFRAPGGIDVNATLDLASPFPDQKEITFPGGVRSEFIVGYRAVLGDQPVGPIHPMPQLSPDTVGSLPATQPAPDAGTPVEAPTPAAQDSPVSAGTKRSRDDFEADEGPVTEVEPPASKPITERLVPPSAAETAALTAVVAPGTRFTDPSLWVGLVNGDRSAAGRDVNCLDSALAFHATYRGEPRVAGASATGAAPGGVGAATGAATSYAPELIGKGPLALAEVIDRVTRGGHGSDAVLIAFPATGGPGHAWNVVNHHGTVSLADPQAGTLTPATPEAITGLGRVYAIPVDPDGGFIGTTPAPVPRPQSTTPAIAAEFDRVSTAPDPDWSAYQDFLDDQRPLLDPRQQAELDLHARDVDMRRIREGVLAGTPVRLRDSLATLVPTADGLRVVGAAITAELAADLAAITSRDVIALVVGSDGEEPWGLRFPPRGRPLPVTEDEV